MIFRAVIDTNTVISGTLRPGPHSPHRQLLRLGLMGRFQLLISDDILLAPAAAPAKLQQERHTRL